MSSQRPAIPAEYAGYATTRRSLVVLCQHPITSGTLFGAARRSGAHLHIRQRLTPLHCA
jgi:hypothetical protein